MKQHVNEATSIWGADDEATTDIRPLTTADVRRLAIDPRRGMDADDVLSLVVQHPGLSMWHPESGEFILVTPWRHRKDLPVIHTISAIRHETELLHAVVRAAAAMKCVALIYVDSIETRRAAFYERHGFEEIEQITTFELSRPRFAPVRFHAQQDFMRVPIRDESWLQVILQLDHTAFPWLWWNSRQEMETYLQYPGVEVWVGTLGDEIVSYVGLTHYYGWGHLDRIATHPAYQGRGLGRESLRFAIERMTNNGARRIALSTQGNNTRSRTLYQNIGFRETPKHDYTVYAVVIDRERLFAGGE